MEHYAAQSLICKMRNMQSNKFLIMMPYFSRSTVKRSCVAWLIEINNLNNHISNLNNLQKYHLICQIYCDSVECICIKSNLLSMKVIIVCSVVWGNHIILPKLSLAMGSTQLFCSEEKSNTCEWSSVKTIHLTTNSEQVDQ